MLQRFNVVNKNEQGFTLLELLVVILIIGILAAIAIPSFLEKRDKSRNSVATSALTNASEKMNKCYAKNGNYRNCGVQADTTQSIRGANYAIFKTSESGYWFMIEHTSGKETRSCWLPKGKRAWTTCPKGWPDSSTQ